MGQFFRILFIVLLFILLFRFIKKLLLRYMGSSEKNDIRGAGKNKKKYDNIEEAKYIDLNDDEERAKKNS